MRWPWNRDDDLRERVERVEHLLLGDVADRNPWREASFAERIDAVEGDVGALQSDVSGIEDAVRHIERTTPAIEDVPDADDFSRLQERVGELESRQADVESDA